MHAIHCLFGLPRWPNKFGKSGFLLYHYFLYPDNEDDHENAKLETLFKVSQFAMRFKKLNHICLNWA